MMIEICDAKLKYAMSEMGFTYEETIHMMAISNHISEADVEEILGDEVLDAQYQEMIQFERASERAWEGSAYDPEAQIEIYTGAL